MKDQNVSIVATKSLMIANVSFGTVYSYVPNKRGGLKDFHYNRKLFETGLLNFLMFLKKTSASVRFVPTWLKR